MESLLSGPDEEMNDGRGETGGTRNVGRKWEERGGSFFLETC
jgi:hypothetical protein